jgi:HPt (histidine-containing phosphotransfer) domain-containing protein
VTGGDADLDGETVEELREQLGDDVLAHVLEAYLDELPRYLAALRSGTAERDATAVHMAAHSLKGASRMIGGEGFAGLCETVEKAAKEGRILDDQVAAIDVTAEAIERAVRALLPA